MYEASANAIAIPAPPAKPPTKMFSGENEAAKFISPAWFTNIAIPAIRSEITSRPISAPRTLAPTSTLRSDRAVTTTQAIAAQTNQGISIPSRAFP